MEHVHKYTRQARPDELSTPQLRKLVFYTGTDIRICECGAIRLADFQPHRTYSRNGSLI